MGTIVELIAKTLTERANERGVEFGERWFSWGEIRDYGDAVERLLTDAGCPPDGRVALIIRNRVPHVAALLGMLARNRPVSFLYSFAPPPAIAEQLRELNPAAIILDVTDWPALAATGAKLDCARLLLGTMDSLPEPAPGGRPSANVTPSVDRGVGAIEVLSSGTTGAPKRISMPLDVLERAAASAPRVEDGSGPAVLINMWPLSGVGGICLLMASAASGGPMCLMEKFSVDEFVSAVRRHRPSVLGMSATAISMVLNNDVPPEDFASVEAIYGGAAHLDPDLQDAFEEKYGVMIYWALGATEFSGTIIQWTPAMRAEVGSSKRGSIGKASKGISLRVVDADSGNVLAVDEVGLMEVVCPQVGPNWMRTTDLIRIDKDGYVFHHGRSDGAIVRGGFKILPEKIVEALRAHPSVADASVVGIPDARLGAVPVAAVELKPGAAPVEEKALTEHVRTVLAPTYVPIKIRVVDALPRTASMKASLVEVRQLFDDLAKVE